MTPTDPQQPKSPQGMAYAPYLAVALAGLLVIAAAEFTSGRETSQLGVWAVLVGWGIVACSHLAAQLIDSAQPVFRMLLAMLVRGMGTAAALIAAVTVGGVEPRTAAFIAAPIYLCLLSAEVLEATGALNAREAGQ